jgi:hypothetical protein
VQTPIILFQATTVAACLCCLFITYSPKLRVRYL